MTSLDILVKTLVGVLKDPNSLPAGVIDSISVPTRHPSGLPASVLIGGRKPGVRPGPDALDTTADELLAALATCLPDSVVRDIRREGDSIALDITGRPNRPSPEASVFMAPLGTPMPPGDAPLEAAGWTPVGFTDGDFGFTTEESPAGDGFAAGIGSLSGSFSASLSTTYKPEDAKAFDELMQRIEDEGIDATVDDAERTVDDMDLDRLAAELRLMLPEEVELEDGAIRHLHSDVEVNGGGDLVEYSADAIVAWFREEVARSRRRAYRTGYAMGRHAAERQEPTA